MKVYERNRRLENCIKIIILGSVILKWNANMKKGAGRDVHILEGQDAMITLATAKIIWEVKRNFGDMTRHLFIHNINTDTDYQNIKLIPILIIFSA